MKALRYIGLLIIMLLPFSVNAESSLSISCNPNEIDAGNKTTCTISGTSEENVDSLSFKITYGDGLSQVSFTENSVWSGATTNGDVINMTPGEGSTITGNFTVGTLVVKAAANAETSTPSITLGSISINEHDATNASFKMTVNAKPAEEKPLLSSLSVSNAIITPNLSDTVFSYSITLMSYDMDSFSITAKAKNSDNTITGYNNDTNERINFNDVAFSTVSGKDNMSIKIEVSSSSATTTYTLVVTKPTPTDIKYPELKSITIGGVDVALESSKRSYTVTLSNLDEYLVTASIKDSHNYKFDDFLKPPFTLSGEKTFEIKIIPKDASSGLKSTSYSFTVKGKAASSSSAPEPSSSSQSSGNSVIIDNPGTGAGSAFFVALILIVSLSISFYLYRKNMSEYN